MTTEIPKSMRAAVLNKIGGAVDVVSEFKVPEIEPHQVLIKIELSGVDHTDLHVCHGDWAVKASTPIITGHEGVGTVVKLGDHAQNVFPIRVGERVGIPWVNGICGHCDQCLNGADNLCPNLSPVGFGVHGTHAEYVAIDAKSVVKIPRQLDSAQAATMLCAGVTAYAAVKECGAYAGQWVAVFGAAGGLGHLAVQFAHHFGFKVCAIDKGRERLNQLQSMGADTVVDASTPENIVMRIHEICQYEGLTSALVCSPDLASYKDALEALKPHGKLMAIAMPSGTVDIDIFQLIVHGKMIRGSIVGSRLDLIETLRLARDGKVKSIISERSLDDINDVFDEMDSEAVTGRVVVRMTA